MKKVLFSLLLALVCLPMAIGQSKDIPAFVRVDTTACGSFTWIDGQNYTSDTAVMFVRNDTAYALFLDISEGADSTEATVVACGHYNAPWGEVLTESGNFVVDTVVNGCTRHDVLDLTINPEYNMDEEEVTAECSYTWGDTVITDLLSHSRTLETVDGCDSVINIRVTSYSYAVTNDIYDTVCSLYIASWGDTIYTSGSYTNVDTTGGCTTTTNVNLVVNPVYTDTSAVVVETVQAGCSYTWNNLVINDTTDTHYVMLTTVAGCDSLAAIQVTSFSGVDSDTTNVEYCGRRYTGWYNKVFVNTTDSSFSLTPANPVFTHDTIVTVNGCEMHRHLNLTFVHEYDTLNVQGCSEATYSFASRDGVAGHRDVAHYSEDGEYDNDENGEPLYSKHWSTGCFIHHHLNVNVIEPEDRVRLDTMVVNRCDSYTFKYRNDPSFVVTSDTAFTYKHEFHDLNNDLCHDSTIYVDITIRYSSHRDTVVITCDTFTWNFDGKLYTATGIYQKKITDTVNSQGCDSIGRLDLTVNKTPTVTIDGNWILQPGESTTLSANCSDENVSYKWYVNNGTTPASTSATLTIEPENGENVDVHLTTTKSYSGGNSCVANNWITVSSNVGIFDVENMQVNLYPNPTSRVLNVQVAEGVNEVTIYNTIGQKMLSQNGNSDIMQLDLDNLSSGSYIIRITAQNGSEVTRKINISK